MNKIEKFAQFNSELTPIIDSLNDVLKKYEISHLDNFISFHVIQGEVKPMLMFDLFPPVSPNVLTVLNKYQAVR